MNPLLKKRIALDVETYRDYFLVKCKGVDSGITRDYEMYAGHPLDVDALRRVLANHTIVGFNINNYDFPVIVLALTGADNAALKALSDWIILGDHRGWEAYDHHGLQRPDWVDSIDLIEVAPGQASLKLYGGRLHSRKLQDLPIDPDASISPAQRQQLISYCENDLDTTIDLYRKLLPQIELRESMGIGYGLDLRSKSDAQIAEVVLRKEVSKLLGRKVERPTIPPGTTFRYKPPAFLNFSTEQLKNKLREVCEAEFVINEAGSPVEPPALAGAVIRIDGAEYRMGIGGLHSSETSVAHFADDDTVLMDADVASFYPYIVLNCGLFPKHMGDAFAKVYRGIVNRRIAAKKAKDTVVADALKITINGSFGKLGSKYSTLYSPDLMIQVTVTGQLALLMLIESLHLRGIRCVSANTDGIVLKFAKSKLELVRATIAEWMTATDFEMEETHYRALLSRDVNNYIALKLGGGVKGKGAYGDVTLSKNPQSQICVDAVKAFLDRGVPIAQTVIGCTDIRKFLTVRTVRGGAIKITRTNYDDDRLTPAGKRDHILSRGWMQLQPGPLAKARFDFIPDGCGYDVETAYRMDCGEDTFTYIGKVVRWYYALGETGAIHYKVANSKGGRNKVPSSDGARPLMELTDTFPTDIDHGYYIGEATAMLKSIGLTL